MNDSEKGMLVPITLHFPNTGATLPSPAPEVTLFPGIPRRGERIIWGGLWWWVKEVEYHLTGGDTAQAVVSLSADQVV